MASGEARSNALVSTPRSARLRVYLELTKPPLLALVLVTTILGYRLAGGGLAEPWRVVWAVLGTALTAAGANALNQWSEAHRDARMRRTCRRPLPTGRIGSAHAFGWAVGVVAIGGAVLMIFVNPLTAALALAAVLIYVLLYTPLKARTSLCTLVGAVCGAVPPVMGWTSATGRLEYGACVLGAIVFIWQVPHFLALGWLYRNDYAHAGFRVLPVADASGRMTCRLAVLYSLALVPIALAATAAGLAGTVYAVGSIVLGAGLALLAACLYRERTEANARRLFLSTIVYLPLLLGLMLADHKPAGRPPVTARVARANQ